MLKVTSIFDLFFLPSFVQLVHMRNFELYKIVAQKSKCTLRSLQTLGFHKHKGVESPFIFHGSKSWEHAILAGLMNSKFSCFNIGNASTVCHYQVTWFIAFLSSSKIVAKLCNMITLILTYLFVSKVWESNIASSKTPMSLACLKTSKCVFQMDRFVRKVFLASSSTQYWE